METATLEAQVERPHSAARNRAGGEAMKWYASGGGIKRMGPFPDQVAAWQSLEVADRPVRGPRQDSRGWPHD